MKTGETRFFLLSGNPVATRGQPEYMNAESIAFSVQDSSYFQDRNLSAKVQVLSAKSQNLLESRLINCLFKSFILIRTYNQFFSCC
jgi:hypothetical protein